MNALLRLGPHTYKWLGISLLTAAVFAVAWLLITDTQGIAYRYWAKYVGELDRKLRSMFLWTPGKHIAYGQAAGMAIVALAGIAFRMHLGIVGLILALVALGPSYHIDRMRAKRIAKIEDQLDGFMMGLANALKSIPSITSAFVSVAPVLPYPIREEVELAIKEMRVGSTLEQALLSMSARVGSRQLDSAFSAIVIGRQIGGNLPNILETTANTLREMSRLEGVVKTKTAEGKAQLWVLAGMPFVLVVGLDLASPGYFQPLQETIFGYILGLVAGVFWLASLLVARKVLAVDV